MFLSKVLVPMKLLLVFLSSCLVLSLPFCFFPHLDTARSLVVQLFHVVLVVSPVAFLFSVLIGWKMRLLSSRALFLALLFGLPVTSVCAVVSSGYLEGYFPLYPHIDTQFADRFSEANWRRVSTGMTKDEVLRLLGQPLSDTNASTSIWSFSRDAKCTWGDFAWQSKVVVFSPDGVVTGKIDRWYND